MGRDRLRVSLLLASLLVGVAASAAVRRTPALTPSGVLATLAGPPEEEGAERLLPAGSLPDAAASVGVYPRSNDHRYGKRSLLPATPESLSSRRRRQASRPPWDLPAFPASRFDWAERGRRIGDYFRERRMRRKYGWRFG